MKEYYFISGLPRSGSTLLSGILRQNPDFYADIASPLQGLVQGIINNITSSESNTTIQEDRRKTILYGLFNAFYDHVNKPIIFDSSRGWTSVTPLLKELFPNTKIICCVREIFWILDSFERIAAKNCLYTNTLVEDVARSNIESRCLSMMDARKDGIVIMPWYWLREGLSLNRDMIHLVEYNSLCKNPEETLRGIYNFIGKEYFEHDFDNVEYENETFDRSLNMKDLHTVKRKVEWVERKTILPDFVIEQFTKKDFWKKKNINYE